jgi:hypothetical protein
MVLAAAAAAGQPMLQSDPMGVLAVCTAAEAAALDMPPAVLVAMVLRV